jgi:hypothetical protein
MELTGLCGQGFWLTLELGQGYSRPPGEEPNRPVLIEPIMPAEQRGQPSEIRVLLLGRPRPHLVTTADERDAA